MKPIRPKFGNEVRKQDLKPKAPQKPPSQFDGKGTRARLETAALKQFFGSKYSK